MSQGIGGIEHQVIPETQKVDTSELKKEMSGEKVKKAKTKPLSEKTKKKISELSTDSS